MDRTGYDGGGRPVNWRRVNAKRPIGHTRVARVRFAVVTEHHQFLERFAVVVDLGLFFSRGPADAIGAGEQAVHVVKAVVLGVNHHHVLDALQVGGFGIRWATGGGAAPAGLQGRQRSAMANDAAGEVGAVGAWQLPIVRLSLYGIFALPMPPRRAPNLRP